MERKRSAGVTILGIVFIIFGFFGLLNVLRPQQSIQFYGIAVFVFSAAISITTLICGIFILKLEERARKTAILLSVASIIFIPIYLKSIISAFNNAEILERQKAAIIQQYKPEYQQKMLADLEEAQKISKKVLPFFIMGIGIFQLSLGLIPIYFFTRPKVREQFQK